MGDRVCRQDSDAAGGCCLLVIWLWTLAVVGLCGFTIGGCRAERAEQTKALKAKAARWVIQPDNSFQFTYGCRCED